MQIDFQNHFRIFSAVLKKNSLEFIRYPMNALFSVLMPFVWFLPTWFLIRSFAPDGISDGLQAWTGNGNFFHFFTVGMVVNGFIFTVFWQMGFTLKRLMDIGMLETIWSTPIRKGAYMIGESLFSLVTLSYQMAMLLLIYRLVFGMALPPGFLEVLPLFIPFLFFLYGLGLLLAALILLIKEANMLVDSLNFIIGGLTGTQTTPRVFPGFLFAAALTIPITHFLDLLRVRSMGIAPLVPVPLELTITFASALVFPILGMAAFLRIDRYARVQGSLAAH